jgi:thiamine-phosphate pyrophosphorylase
MSLNLQLPILYAITRGATSSDTTPEDDDFCHILDQIQAAVEAEISFFQVREKKLTTRVLHELVRLAAELTRGTATRLFVNDRFDVARAAGADGVQLTSLSLPPRVVREACDDEFLIGASTHSLETAREARDGGADFVVFGPVFETESKLAYGPPQGLEKLREVTKALDGFPVIAIGGITLDNAQSCFEAGASGIAAIRLFDASTE